VSHDAATKVGQPGARAEPEAAAASGARLRMRGLSRWYGDTAAVYNLSLEVEPGEFLTLLGASGSGKTTTLMMIAGFTTPSEGEIAIGERSLVHVPPEKRNIGVVFQNYALFPHMTVAENVGFPLRMRRMGRDQSRAQVEEALKLVHLEGFGERSINHLSGGQQQRVALARALVFRPPVLLMDEPLGALDRKLREQMQVEIKRIQRSLGITVVYVTHDQEEALVMSDRIAIMHEGVIQQVDTPAAVYERPASPFVADFLGESNLLAGVVERAAAGATVVRLEDGTTIRALPAEAREGQSVQAMVRPEVLRLVPGGEDADDDNVLPGVIEEAVYLGQSIRYTVKLGAARVLVRSPGGAGRRSWEVGTRASVAWPASATLVFPQD